MITGHMINSSFCEIYSTISVLHPSTTTRPMPNFRDRSLPVISTVLKRHEYTHRHTRTRTRAHARARTRTRTRAHKHRAYTHTRTQTHRHTGTTHHHATHHTRATTQYEAPGIYSNLPFPVLFART